MSVFLDSQRRLRNGWWVGIFFAVLAAMLVPLMVVTQRLGGDVSLGAQFAVVAVASSICQLLRRRPMTELTGPIDRAWAAQLLGGCFWGAMLMLIPAAFLLAVRAVSWTWGSASLRSIVMSTALCAGVAATEELLFRGFVFQRLIDGAGIAVAQIVISAYFVLTHSTALANAGELRYLAATNIFVASLLFGLAFIRTKRLALPLGLHFGANFMQGTVLGFGVSGSTQPRLLVPHAGGSPDWLTGGAFGLEASVGGLIAVIAALLALHRRRRRDPSMPPSLHVRE